MSHGQIDRSDYELGSLGEIAMISFSTKSILNAFKPNNTIYNATIIYKIVSMINESCRFSLFPPHFWSLNTLHIEYKHPETSFWWCPFLVELL